MKAAFLVGPKKVEIREVPTPAPGKGEVLIRVREAGICGTDYALFLGKLPIKLPIIPGHEAVGEIAALGPEVEGRGIGERVTIQPNFSCGKCPSCLNGRENICLNKIRLGLDRNGVFSQYVTVPQKYVWPLPEDLSNSEGTLIEPLSVSLHGINKSPPSPDERVLVYGAGVIGLLFVQLAVLLKGWVAAVDIADPRLAIARALGAKKTYNSMSELGKEAGSFSVIYETSGTGNALSRILKLIAPGGRVVLTGLPERDSPVSTALMVRKEIVIHGSMIYKDEFPAAINLLKRGEVKTNSLISEAYPLENLMQAFEDFQSPKRVKTLLHIP
jgi:L-iditol 2-dehydrogenase